MFEDVEIVNREFALVGGYQPHASADREPVLPVRDLPVVGRVDQDAVDASRLDSPQEPPKSLPFLGLPFDPDVAEPQLVGNSDPVDTAIILDGPPLASFDGRVHDDPVSGGRRRVRGQLRLARLNKGDLNQCA